MKSVWKLVFLIVLGSSAACDAWDQLEFRNRTSEEVQIKLSLSDSYSTFRCEDGHTLSSHKKELSQTLATGENICHTGPITGRHYDARDDIERLTISRAGRTCIDVDGPTARPWFFREDERNVLVIEDARCPSQGVP